MSDLFAAGDLIATRVATITALRSVQYGSRIVGPNSNSTTLPAAFVIPDEATGGLRGTIDSSESDKSHETQQWVVGIRAELDPAATAANSAETRLGALAIEIIKKLRGWSPGSGIRHMGYIKRTPVQYPEASGYAEIWLTFDCVVQIT